MTIKQFQELYYISQSNDHDFDKSIKMVGCITSKTPDQVETMSMARFNKVCEQAQRSFNILGEKLHSGKPKKLVLINGHIYQLRYDIKHINAGKYVEAVTFGADVIDNLHKIMATIAVPVSWMGKPIKRDHAEVAKDMEAMDFKDAYHAAVFFYTLFQVSMEIIQPYLVDQATKKGANRKEVERTLQSLSKTLAGFAMPKWSLTTKTYLLNRFGI